MRTDFEARREELKQELSAELAKLDREEKLAAILPEGYEWRIHWHSLYGSVGHAYVKHDFFDYSHKKQPIGLADVAKLAEALPPLPLRKIKDGCTSFRTAEHVDAIPEEKKERWEELDVAPFVVKVSGFQHQTATFEWNTATEAGVICVSVEIPLPQELGRLEIRYEKFMGGRRVDTCTFHPGDNLYTIMRDGEALAQLESPIKWASGSDETPNDFTLYFCPLGEDMTITAADLVRTIMGE